MFDILIKDGKVIDGTGRAAYQANVAVETGLIVEVGQGVIRAAGNLLSWQSVPNLLQ
jgi:N-acyl-D-aspartate/D-glutamate deacylase